MKIKYSKNRRLGNKAEDLSCVFLNNMNYKILARNFLKRVGEIDIVAIKDNVYHFVEIKSVTRETSWDYVEESTGYFAPEDKMNFDKICKIRRTINLFLIENSLCDVKLQIDLITVCFYKSGEVPRIDFIENI